MIGMIMWQAYSKNDWFGGELPEVVEYFAEHGMRAYRVEMGDYMLNPMGVEMFNDLVREKEKDIQAMEEWEGEKPQKRLGN